MAKKLLLIPVVFSTVLTSYVLFLRVSSILFRNDGPVVGRPLFEERTDCEKKATFENESILAVVKKLEWAEDDKLKIILLLHLKKFNSRIWIINPIGTAHFYFFGGFDDSIVDHQVIHITYSAEFASRICDSQVIPLTLMVPKTAKNLSIFIFRAEMSKIPLPPRQQEQINDTARG